MKNTIRIDKSLTKILLIGANGFLGTNIIQLFELDNNLKQRFSIIAADIENINISKNVEYFNIDITDSNDVEKKIKLLSPDIIILSAAMTNVDQNEINKELAIKINTQGPINVLNASKIVGSKLLFMSTDFIFDGLGKEGGYSENDIPNPISHYGKTKLDAEKAIINSNIDFLICRTAVLYGWHKFKLNFITWILKSLKENKKISITTSQINNATYVPNLSKILLKLIEKDAKGIFHTAGDGGLTRYEMALKCAEVFNYEKNLIKPITELKQTALRPKNATLNISKLKKILGSELKVLSLEEGLKLMKTKPI